MAGKHASKISCNLFAQIEIFAFDNGYDVDEKVEAVIRCVLTLHHRLRNYCA